MVINCSGLVTLLDLVFLQGGSTDTQSSKSESHESGEGGLFVGVKTTAEVGLITSDSHSESLDTTTTSMFNDIGVKTTAQHPCSMMSCMEHE